MGSVLVISNKIIVFVHNIIHSTMENEKECNCNCWDCDYCYPRMITEIESNVEKPFITATFGDNWKEHAIKNYPLEIIVDIAWKNGRKAILLERALKDYTNEPFFIEQAKSAKDITSKYSYPEELDSTRHIPTTESNEEDVMQSYRTRQRLLNNEIYALKKEIAQLKANNSLLELEKYIDEGGTYISISGKEWIRKDLVVNKIQELKTKQ
jgi:hypothetical protein